ncbi:MAG: YigZ family protein [Eubacteriales bacterium]|nr:YigZ family protein [Eubacteriales bacterium]
MSMLNKYLSVARSASAELVEKKSRFIASVSPAESETEALDFISSIRAENRGARHNVYAYKIADDTVTQRFSDDGEPSGTAGMPVIEVINRTGIVNVAIVVTRYFGGILLGAPGLTRAYAKSAAMGIEAAGIINNILCTIFKIKSTYSNIGKIRNAMAGRGYAVEDIDFAEEVDICVAVPEGEEKIFSDLIDEVTGKSAIIIKDTQKYCQK